MFQFYQNFASNVHWGSPPKTKPVLLFVLRAVLDRTKIKPVEVIASSVPLVHSWLNRKAPKLAHRARLESTKTKKDKLNVNRARQESGAIRLVPWLLETAKIAKSASILHQLLLILIVSFARLELVVKTASRVVQTWLCAKHAMPVNSVMVVTLWLHRAVIALLASTRITKAKVHACHAFRKFGCFTWSYLSVDPNVCFHYFVLLHVRVIGAPIKT